MKYMGSKNRIAKHILPIILKDRKEGQWYVEPFCGGCNTLDKVTGNRIGNDVNFYLISFLKELQRGWTPPKKPLSKVEYGQIRESKELYEPHFVGYVGVCCSYSGKWFGGFAGLTRTKIGTVRDYIAEANRSILLQAPLLSGVIFSNDNYSTLPIPPNSIIYCDPPYAGTTGYTGSESDFNHGDFWEWCRGRAKEGHQVFISEYSAPADFVPVWEGKVKSSLSANGISGRSMESVEKLFKYSPVFNELD
jgi:DNA adenine methylase